MARPARVWYRADIGCWMVIINGVREKLLYGPKDEHHRELAEEEFVRRRKTARVAPGSSRTRVHDLVIEFMSHSKLHHAADTYRINRYYCQLLTEECGELVARDLRPFHINRWVDSKISAKEWGPTTAYNARRVSSRVLSWAVAEKIIADNPLAGMRNPKPPPRARAVTEGEYRSLYANAGGPFRDFLQALYHTGARPKEVRTLRWTMVKADRWVLPEHKTHKKTGKPRTVYLDETMRAMMERLPRTSEWVFLNTVGKPWTMTAVRQQIWRIKRKLGLASDLCAYLFRHGFGTRSILAGNDGLTTAELMGHTSQEMISKVYVHLAGEHQHLAEAVGKVTPSAAAPTPAPPDPGPARIRARVVAKKPAAASEPARQPPPVSETAGRLQGRRSRS